MALTRIMSAVFRKGGDVTFLVEEMKAVFEPDGGYFKAGGMYVPSIVAEIGAVVEQHMKAIGLIKDPEMSASQKALIAENRAAYEAAQPTDDSDENTATGTSDNDSFPSTAACATSATPRRWC